MSWIDGQNADKWIEENHPKNGVFRVYWKDVISIEPLEGGVTLDINEGEGLRWEWYYKEGAIDGVSMGWYPNGQLKQERRRKNGKHHGLWTEWFDNGKKKSEGIYKNGKKDGVFTQWYDNGEKWTEVIFKNGRERPDVIYKA